MKPRFPERFERVLESILDLNNRAILPRILCPTLVLGGMDDRLISAEVQREMAKLIPHSHLKLYPGYGHGNDLENPDHEVQVIHFIEAVANRSRHLFSYQY